MSDTQDVVVYEVKLLDSGAEIRSTGRDTQAVAAEFCRRPKWPYKLTDKFVAVDEWGYGKIVAATPELSNWLQAPFSAFKNAVRAA